MEAIDACCQKRGGRYEAADAKVCMGRGIPFTARHLETKYGWGLDVDAYVTEVCDDFARRVHAAPGCLGAEELLRGLRGRRQVALGSSSTRPLVEAALGPRGWLPLFDTLVTGSDVARLKPAPDIYLEAARRLGQPPERCVVLEDSPVGCEAARAAGMFVVAVPGAHTHETPRADLIVASLTDAAEVLGLLR